MLLIIYAEKGHCTRNIWVFMLFSHHDDVNTYLFQLKTDIYTSSSRVLLFICNKDRRTVHAHGSSSYYKEPHDHTSLLNWELVNQGSDVLRTLMWGNTRTRFCKPLLGCTHKHAIRNRRIVEQETTRKRRMTKRINKRWATGNDVYLRPVRRIMDDSCLRFLRKEEVEEEGCRIDKRTEKKKVGDRERKRMREELWHKKYAEQRWTV